MIRAVLLTSLGIAATGCLMPRSSVYGQTGSALGRGAGEVGLSTGVGIQLDTSPQTPLGGNSYRTTTTRVFAVPSFEANAQLGVTDWLGVNLHASPAGVQPGVKFTLLNGSLQLSLMPEVAVGFGISGSTETTVTGTTPVDVDKGTNYFFNFAAGLKLLLSYRDGLYGGLGYDYQSLSISQVNAAGINTGNSQLVSHNLSVALGFNFTAGPFSLRPEVAALLLPSNSQTTTVGAGAPTTLTNGVELMFFPSLTIAAASHGKGKPLEGMKLEELAQPPLVPAP